jgi:hypothetical protein
MKPSLLWFFACAARRYEAVPKGLGTSKADV